MNRSEERTDKHLFTISYNEPVARTLQPLTEHLALNATNVPHPIPLPSPPGNAKDK